MVLDQEFDLVQSARDAHWAALGRSRGLSSEAMFPKPPSCRSPSGWIPTRPPVCVHIKGTTPFALPVSAPVILETESVGLKSPTAIKNRACPHCCLWSNPQGEIFTYTKYIYCTSV